MNLNNLPAIFVTDRNGISDHLTSLFQDNLPVIFAHLMMGYVQDFQPQNCMLELEGTSLYVADPIKRAITSGCILAFRDLKHTTGQIRLEVIKLIATRKVGDFELHPDTRIVVLV